jgi:hypothetical protein
LFRTLALGCTVKAVEMKLYRARQLLREKFLRDDLQRGRFSFRLHPMFPPEPDWGEASVKFEGPRKMLNCRKSTFCGD